MDFKNVKELEPGHAIITKKSGKTSIKKIIEPLERKACSFERIYFSRGSDAEIYKERKELGKLLMPRVLEAINNDIKNTVFSYIPNTAETSFFGMIEMVEKHLNEKKTKAILRGKRALSAEKVTEILSERPRIEKIAIKDVKLRTFITEDDSRDDLVEHVYDITYGVIKPTDNLVIIDDSIVRGTTLKKSIIKMMDRLNPKKIIVVSSAPQIRYPDCYGIDMARLEDFVAFRALIALLKETDKYHLVEEVYQKCKAQSAFEDVEIQNFVKDLYAEFTNNQIETKISALVCDDTVNAEVQIIFQPVENLHLACPKNLGDWYFTGDYPTPGGNRVVNTAFINFYEGNRARAY